MPRVPLESRVFVNDIEIAVTEWPGDGPPVFFCHATGFHARVWDQVIAHLPGHRCIAFDARGHGRSSKPAPPYSWRSFGTDAAALTKLLGLAGAIGVGHSMGGHSVTLAAALQPPAFASLVLLDPVIRANEAYRGPWKKTAFVAKRRNQWVSALEMFERFENRAPFVSWDRQVLRDYCDHALTPAGEAFVLACHPEIEAAIYDGSTAVESNIHPEISGIQIPVRVVRSGLVQDSSNIMGLSPTAPNLAESFAHGSDICLAGHSHFIPMEAPGLTAKIVTDTGSLL